MAEAFIDMIAICPGEMNLRNGIPRCGEVWEFKEYIAVTPQFEIADVDPAVFSAYVGAGFFTLLPIYAAVIGCRALIKIIK